MKIVLGLGLGLGLLLAIWTGWGSFSILSTPRPSYNILQNLESKVELRAYGEQTWISAPKGSDNNSFRVLASYIFGGNETGESISMTAPVINDETMSFILPEGMTEASTPAPAGQDIDFKTVPPRTLAVLTFGWFSGTERVEKMVERLESVLRQNEIPYIGKAILMRYNDPATPPFMRRNEVAFELLADFETQE
ncbi:heme-binding protein [bacterium]|nr:heme-binding protein [bacterium]